MHRLKSLDLILEEDRLLVLVLVYPLQSDLLQQELELQVQHLWMNDLLLLGLQLLHHLFLHLWHHDLLLLDQDLHQFFLH